MKQSEIISLLLRENAYNHKVHKIRVEETHVSWVILTGMYVYKIKKELKFGKVLENFEALRKLYNGNHYDDNSVIDIDKLEKSPNIIYRK